MIDDNILLNVNLFIILNQAVIRVRFSDGYVLEANFQPSEPIQTLIDLLSKVIARPDVPFYICKHNFIEE